MKGAMTSYSFLAEVEAIQPDRVQRPARRWPHTRTKPETMRLLALNRHFTENPFFWASRAVNECYRLFSTVDIRSKHLSLISSIANIVVLTLRAGANAGPPGKFISKPNQYRDK
jgi:hypothetical protein